MMHDVAKVRRVWKVLTGEARVALEPEMHDVGMCACSPREGTHHCHDVIGKHVFGRDGVAHAHTHG